MEEGLDIELALSGASASEEAQLRGLRFVQDAVASKLLDIDRACDAPLTIFVPLEYRSDPSSFAQLWNRHCVLGHRTIGKEFVHQSVCTRAALTYALHHDGETPQAGVNGKSGYLIGGVSIESFWNLSLNGRMYHGVRTGSLPDIRLLPGVTGELKMSYLAGEELELAFDTSHFAREESLLTLVTTLTREDRTCLMRPQKTAWAGRGTTCHFVFPSVSTATDRLILWFQLVHNELNTVIVSTTLSSWYLEIVPNVDMRPNPSIVAINPQVGKADDELWIYGSSFDRASIRVMVGEQVAEVHDCVSNLIRCCIPPGTGKNVVWVANGNVCAYYDSFCYRS